MPLKILQRPLMLDAPEAISPVEHVEQDSTPRRSLYHTFIGQYIGRTQQERERLDPSTQESIRERPSAETVDFLTQSTDDEEDTYLSKVPTRPIPHFTEGKRVFTDQAQMEKIIADEGEASKPFVSFNKTFQAARASGNKEFIYKGNHFNTRKKDETNAEWLTKIKTIKGPSLTELIEKLRREHVGPEQNRAKFEENIMQVTNKLNAKRAISNLRQLRLSSGFRNIEEQVNAMMQGVKTAGSLEQARRNGYTGKHYQPALETYYKRPTQSNLEKIGKIRLERELSGGLTGGHSKGDSADYSVSDLTTRSDALKRVEWLNSQGYQAHLENWSGVEKGENAHIHVDGIKSTTSQGTM